MTRGSRLRVIVGSILLLSSFAASASAQRQGDGLYGRWDRGLTLSFGAGPGATWLNGKADPNVVGEARFLVADVAGVVLSGRWGPDSGQHLFLGVDLRPLYGGIATALISIPLRYMHTPVEVLDWADLEGAVKLLSALCSRITKDHSFVPN